MQSIIFMLLPFILLATSCVHKKDTLDSSTLVSTKEHLPPLKVEQRLTRAPYSEQFCEDSIYAKYLKKKFQKEYKRPKKRQSRRQRIRLERRIKHLARSYAFDALKGQKNHLLREIPLSSDPKVVIWMRYFKSSRGRPLFLKWLYRGSKIQDSVLRQLREEGLPKELFYLAMIESGFSNKAYSRARASGAWQFMGPTAKSYGLKINYWVDERRDLDKATLAAARYIRHLNRRFNNWYLAFAAYNAGPGKIKRAIRRTRVKDYWHISKTRYLRSETKHYVPKMLAAYEIATSPQDYGFTLFEPETESKLISVAVDEPVHLRDLARAMDIPYQNLRRWNPELIRNITPPRRGKNPASYPLKISVDHEQKFYDVFGKVEKMAIKDIHIHTVKKGETILHIARRFRILPQKILAMNPKVRPRTLRIGKKIAIPIPSATRKKTRR